MVCIQKLDRTTTTTAHPFRRRAQRVCFASPPRVCDLPAPAVRHPPRPLRTDRSQQRKDHSSCPRSHLPLWLNTASSAARVLEWTLPSVTQSESWHNLRWRRKCWPHCRLTLRRSWKAWVRVTLGRCWTTTRRVSSCNSVTRLFTCCAHLTSGRLPISCSVPQSSVTEFCTVWMKTSISYRDCFYTRTQNKDKWTQPFRRHTVLRDTLNCVTFLGQLWTSTTAKSEQ